jgi:excisionase family DNA binding protein
VNAIELRDYLNQSQAADKMKVHRCTIWRWIRDGKIQTVLVGGMVMIPLSEVERIQSENSEDGAAGETTTAPA